MKSRFKRQQLRQWPSPNIARIYHPWMLCSSQPRDQPTDNAPSKVKDVLVLSTHRGEDKRKVMDGWQERLNDKWLFVQKSIS